jgi:outer membrane protein OmpA-like peptidoglycan-associated protein
MYSEDEDTPKRAALIVVFGVVAAVVAAVVAFGAMHRKADMAPSTVLATATAMVAASSAPTADASAAALAASDAASIKIENGVVKFYFASGKADLAAGAGEALADVVKQAKEGASSGRKLLVSGFHDATGNAAQNAELAKQRAIAVRGALVAAGVAESQVELKKPEETQAGTNAEARRVEVSVQ